MERYKRIFQEKMMSGVVRGNFGNVNAFLFEIESREEFNKLIEKNSYARGIIVKNKFYILNETSGNRWGPFLHNTIIDFLIKKRILSKDAKQNVDYDELIDMFLTVQVNKDTVYLGESHGADFKDEARRGEHPEFYAKVKKYFKVLDKLGIPYKMEFI